MTAEHRQMWADLYRYFDKVMQTDPHDKQHWHEIGAEGTELWLKYNEDEFVREVVCATFGYRMILDGRAKA